MRKTVLVAAAVVVVLVLAGRGVAGETLREVLVRNFPELQRIEGEVRVPAPIPAARRLAPLAEVVPPTPREDTAHLVAAGTVELEGFSHLVVSLEGEVKDRVFRPGPVGVLLVPDEEAFLTALRDDGRALLALEVEAEATPATGDARFAAQRRFEAGFPRYQVFLWNGTDRSVESRVWVYATQG